MSSNRGLPQGEDRPSPVRTAAFLPILYADTLEKAESFTDLVQEAVRAAKDGLVVVFYRPSKFGNNPISNLSPADRRDDWDSLQRFFGIIYGAAGREAARLDRPLLDVLVLVDGLMERTLWQGDVSEILLLDGEDLDETTRFLDHKPAPQIVSRFEKRLAQTGGRGLSPDSSRSTRAVKQDSRHPITALGGTFDHLHGGHKILLTMAVAITKRRLIIGLTVDVMLKSKSYADLLEPYENRAESLRSFLEQLCSGIDFDIVALRDTYGPTATDGEITALVVSRESAAGGLAIDREREQKGLARLQTYIIDVVSGNHNLNDSKARIGDSQKPLLMESTADASQLKELKLGSTFIRQWLANRQQDAKSPLSTSLSASRKDHLSARPQKRQKSSAQAVPPTIALLNATRTAYEATSQRLRWTYSDKELTRVRTGSNERAVEQCRKHWNLEASILAGEGNASLNPPTKFPGLEEEQLLVAFYASSIGTIIAGGGLNNGRPIPSAIEGVAITFLKRFYLRTSVLEWHPKVIMLVCLFLAGKVCNHVFDIDHYVASFKKIKREDILGPEYLVLQTLRFDMYVPRMQDALHGWFLKLQDANPTSMNRIEAAYFGAQLNLKRSRLSDVEFIYTPSQIAATCFLMADDNLFQTALDQLLPVLPDSIGVEETTPSGPLSKQLLAREQLLDILTQIQTAIESAPVEGSFDMNKVKGADKLVKSTQDPARNKTSGLYRRQQQQTEAEQAERRALRLRRAQQDSKDRDDFFGAPVRSSLPIDETMTAGIKAEGGGLTFGGEGLKMVGMNLDSSDSE